MCLAIPGKVVEIYEEDGLKMGKVDFEGIVRKACFEYVPDIELGDYALVHVGFAISTVDEEEARQVFEFLDRMEELDELHAPSLDEADAPLADDKFMDIQSFESRAIHNEE